MKKNSKKKADYFPMLVDFHSSPIGLKIRRVYGLDGYGVFIILNEKICGTKERELEINSIEELLWDLRCNDEEKVKSIIKEFFEEVDGKIKSPYLEESMEFYDDKYNKYSKAGKASSEKLSPEERKEKASNAAKSRWDANDVSKDMLTNANDVSKDMLTNANDVSMDAQNKSKVNKRKEKESELNEIKEKESELNEIKEKESKREFLGFSSKFFVSPSWGYKKINESYSHFISLNEENNKMKFSLYEDVLLFIIQLNVDEIMSTEKLLIDYKDEIENINEYDIVNFVKTILKDNQNIKDQLKLFVHKYKI